MVSELLFTLFSQSDLELNNVDMYVAVMLFFWYKYYGNLPLYILCNLISILSVFPHFIVLVEGLLGFELFALLIIVCSGSFYNTLACMNQNIMSLESIHMCILISLFDTMFGFLTFSGFD